MRYGEIGISAGMASLAVFFYSLATFQQEMNPADPGPAFYPRLISLLLVVFAVAQMAISWRQNGLAGEKQGKEGAGRLPYIYVGGTLVISLIYLLLFKGAGYFWTTAGFLLALMLLGGVRNWLVLSSVALGYSLVTYYLFGQVLMVPLP
ncbi:MAG: tripartite tricarboxylate transporter TctB family protein [Firmicutes bacterium]|nr:tripartite tricarboxylate transporter TctB family protein [Bacillota bacterium]MCL5039703.1 tripartite tricarboxylate transporter TctB family protein [Bacillota bacterium]